MHRTRWTALALALTLLTACGDKDDDDDGGGGDTAAWDSGSAGLSGACELARRYDACDECYDGEVTCTYGEFSATEGSCADCQALGALYDQLCDAGVTDGRADIEAGTECSDPE